MRRVVAVLLILCMVFAFAGCSKKSNNGPVFADDEPGNAMGVDLSAFDGTYLQQYLELIASRNFFYQKIGGDDGEIITFTCIGQDEKVSITDNISIIKTGDGKIYYCEGNYYFELTPEVAAQGGITDTYENIKTMLASFEALTFGMLQLVPMTLDTTVDLSTIEGMENYIHEEYMDIDNNRAYSFFFVRGTGELNSILDVADGKTVVYQAKMGTPSPNAISNTFANATLVDNATSIQGAQQSQDGGTSYNIEVEP